MPEDLDLEVPYGASFDQADRLPEPTARKTADDLTRMVVAYVLLGMIFVVIIAAFAALFVINAHSAAPIHDTNVVEAAKLVGDDNAADADRLMKLMDVVFGPIVTLFSSVVGFYFGARTARDAKQR